MTFFYLIIPNTGAVIRTGSRLLLKRILLKLTERTITYKIIVVHGYHISFKGDIITDREFLNL